MDYYTYDIESKIEADHWWYSGRRKLFSSLIKQTGILKDAYILDIGSSTGSNLRMLREGEYTNYIGIDNNPDAVHFCRKKGFTNTQIGDACDMPFADNTFDFVMATDIIEHIDDDSRALDEIARVLKPKGKVLLAVPACNALWEPKDIPTGHKRRYNKALLLKKIRESSLTPICDFYYNYLLFLPILIVRNIARILNVRIKSENKFNTKILNSILSLIFSIDVKTAPVLHPPFGVSILVVAEKK